MVHEVFGLFLGKIIIQAIDFNGGGYRNRTGVHGFAIRCITTTKAHENRTLEQENPLLSQCSHKGAVKWEVFVSEV